MDSTVADAEAELERFRDQWRAEVTRNKQRQGVPPAESSANRPQKKRDVAPQSTAGPSVARRREVQDLSEEVEPRAYHDLPDKEEALRLGVEGSSDGRKAFQEPSTALEHYEHAVEKETQGHLGDSIKHYRKAFKVRLPPSYPRRNAC